MPDKKQVDGKEVAEHNSREKVRPVRVAWLDRSAEQSRACGSLCTVRCTILPTSWM